MIAICIPSRGMMHSRTMDDVLKNIQYAQSKATFNVPFDARFIFSHGRPQPDAENYIIEEALKINPDFIWVIDDDMQFPENVLYDMLALPNKDVVVAHYPVARDQDALHIRDGKFESAGMGCMLIRPSVFEKLERPYFRCDIQYIWDGEKLVSSPVPPNHAPESIHGNHDVYFSQKLIKAGIEPAIIETRCGQYNLLDINIRKYGNYTQQNVETWRL